MNTVQELVNKVKNDAHLSNSSKMDTLALLVMRFVEENSEYDNSGIKKTIHLYFPY